jgi:hypothetical protein
MLIDAHCHIMPDRLAHAIRRFFRDFMNEGTLRNSTDLRGWDRPSRRLSTPVHEFSNV